MYRASADIFERHCEPDLPPGASINTKMLLDATLTGTSQIEQHSLKPIVGHCSGL